MDAGEELLEAFEVGGAFDGDERVAVVGAGGLPALGDGGGVGGGVRCFEEAEAGLLDESLVVAGWGEDVGADGAAGGDLLVGDGSAEDEGIAEEQAAAGLEDAEDFREEGVARGDVAENIVGEGGVERLAGEGQRLCDIAQLKGSAAVEVALARESCRRCECRLR